MKEVFLIFARYNREANQTIVSILKELSHEEREKDRGSFYKSLSGLLAHILGGTRFFLGIFKAAVPHNATAVQALSQIDKIAVPEGKLSETQWKQLVDDLAAVDDAFVNFVTALTDADIKAPVKLDWYGGNPASVPLSFMLQQLAAHGTHHRGQISQILDSLTIANDYSGINEAFLSV
ncbi:MAG: DinB family protein [Treponema sp.]|jgi:uncharacterized damage-inducible protein DinB|nr:DinB family protein [Treponema sp.]